MESWRAFRALDAGDRRLILEATVLLGFVWVGLRTLPFGPLRRALRACAMHTRVPSSTPRDRIGWAVSAAGRRFRARTCLIEALAADVMLQRRGYRSELRFGVRKGITRSQPIDAHVWVEGDEGVVVGKLDDLAEY